MERRARNLKTGLICSTYLDQADSYHYDEKTACGFYAELPRYAPAEVGTVVTCFFCISCLSNRLGS